MLLLHDKRDAAENETPSAPLLEPITLPVPELPDVFNSNLPSSHFTTLSSIVSSTLAHSSSNPEQSGSTLSDSATLWPIHLSKRPRTNRLPTQPAMLGRIETSPTAGMSAGVEPYLNVEPDEETLIKGTSGTQPGIFSYGLFPTSVLPQHSTIESSVYLLTEVPNISRGGVYKLPLSPYVLLPQRHGRVPFIYSGNRHIPRYPQFQESISRGLLANPIRVPDPDSNVLYCRFPPVENLLCTLAARCPRPRLGHPCGYYELDEIRTLVSLPPIAKSSHPDAAKCGQCDDGWITAVSLMALSHVHLIVTPNHGGSAYRRNP